MTISADAISKNVAKFYDANSQYWSVTRSAPWKGWDILWDLVVQDLSVKKEINILDVGCGNARLANFYFEKIKTLPGGSELKINYIGIDISKNLLNIAEESLQKLQKENSNFNYKLAQVDLTVEPELRSILEGFSMRYDVINLIAVLHHIPTQADRNSLLSLLAKYLNINAFLSYTVWDFLAAPGTQKLILAGEMLAQAIANNNLKLAAGDYLLSWNKQLEKRAESDAYRFAHHFSESELMEMQELLQAAGLDLLEKFSADGKNAKLNIYYIFKN